MPAFCLRLSSVRPGLLEVNVRGLEVFLAHEVTLEGVFVFGGELAERVVEAVDLEVVLDEVVDVLGLDVLVENFSAVRLSYLMIWFFDFLIIDFRSNLKGALPKFTDSEAPSPLIPTAGKTGSSDLFSKLLSRSAASTEHFAVQGEEDRVRV